MLKLFGMLHHLVGLLLRALNAQVTGTKPLQVHSAENLSVASELEATSRIAGLS
ncbi:hypothetical protein ABIE62_002942 [Porphyrobacter sp. MBR-155]